MQLFLKDEFELKWQSTNNKTNYINLHVVDNTSKSFVLKFLNICNLFVSTILHYLYIFATFCSSSFPVLNRELKNKLIINHI